MAEGLNTQFQQNIPQSGLVQRKSDLMSFQKSATFQANNLTYFVDAKTMRLDAMVARCPEGSTFILGPGNHCVGATIHLTQRCRIIGQPSALLGSALTYLDHDDIELDGVVFNNRVVSTYNSVRLTGCSWNSATTNALLLQLTGSNCIVSRCWSEATVPGAVGIDLLAASSCVVYGTDFSTHAAPIVYNDNDFHHLICNLGMPRDMVNYLRVNSLAGTYTRHVTVDALGDIGTGLFWDDLVTPATLVNLLGPSAPPAYDNTNQTLDFSAAADNDVQFNFQIPHAWAEGTTVYFHAHWYPSNNNNGNIVWRWNYRWTNIGDVVGAWTTSSATEAASGVTGKQVAGAILAISGATKTVSSILQIQLTRVGTDPGDTFTGLAKALSFDVHYQKDAPGSVPQNTKT